MMKGKSLETSGQKLSILRASLGLFLRVSDFFRINTSILSSNSASISALISFSDSASNLSLNKTNKFQ